MIRQSASPSEPRARNRCGRAVPTDSAPISTPIAMPRPARNQPEMSFMPTGYTPAMPTPVMNRNGRAEIGSVASQANPRFAAAVTTAPQKKSRSPRITSAAPVVARIRAPTANPIWTATVSIATSRPWNCQWSFSSGVTADELNQGASASRIPIDRTMRARQRPAGSTNELDVPAVSTSGEVDVTALRTVSNGDRGPGATLSPSSLQPLEPLHGQHEDRRAANLDFERIGHEELARLHDRGHRVHDLRS